MIKQWFQKKVINPLIDLLKQGVTVEKMSWSLSFGIVICCFPILGTTSVLCFIAAVIFRLNHIAIQIANYVAYPLQFALLIPFLHFGNKIFGYPKANLNLSEMMTEFQIDPWLFLESYAGLAGRAVVAWGFVAPLALILFYFIVKPFVSMLLRLKSRL